MVSGLFTAYVVLAAVELPCHLSMLVGNEKVTKFMSLHFTQIACRPQHFLSSEMLQIVFKCSTFLAGKLGMFLALEDMHVY